VIASITSDGFTRINDVELKTTYEAIARGVGQR
jgi:hypothetical protein